MGRRIWIFVVMALLLGALPAQAANLDVPGKSALLMDVATGQVLYEQNAHEPLPPASVTKVMTMLLVMEAIDSGKIGWNDTVTASEAAAAKGGSQIYLKVGETMSVSDMLKSIAVSSANDCACAMAEHIAGSESAFAELMNRRAKELGMNDTNFVNCTGLDDGEDAANHKTSAYDIALMSQQLLKYHPDIKKFTTIWMDTVRDGAFGLSNTNKLVRFYSGATGLKTGFTTGAGYCLSASAQRFAACKSMLDYGFANFALVAPQIKGDLEIPVKLGAQSSVKAVPGEEAQMLIDKSQRDMVTTDFTLEEEVTAPVSCGQRLGTMTVRAGEQILAQIPLVAEKAVPRLTWSDLFLKLLGRMAMAKQT